MTERIPRRKINPVYIHEGFLFRLVKLCQDKSELLYCSERQTSIGCTASAKRINDVITVTRAHHGHEPNDEVAKAKFIRYNIRMSAESSMPPRDLISEANTSFGEESVSMAGSLDSLNRMIRRARQEGPPHMVTAAAADKTNTNNSDNHNQNDESKEDANSTTMSEVELKVVNGRVCLLLKNDLPISDFLTIMQAGESTPDLINELPPTTPIFNICEAYLIRPNLTKKLLEHDDFTPWHKGGLKKLSERHEIHNYRSEGNGIFVPCRKKCEATHFLKIQFNSLVACPSLNRKIFRMVSVEDPESHVLPSLIVYTFIGGDHPIPQQKRRSDLLLSEIVPKIAKMSPNLSLEAMLNGDFQGLLNSNIEIIGDEEKRSLENPTTSGLIEPKIETIEAEESGENDVQNDFSQQIVPTITDNHQSLFTGQSQLPPFPTTDSILEMFSAGVLSGATVPAPFFHPIVIPIADLEENSRSCSAEEITQRNKLACLYRLVDLFRWSQGIYNHITVRVSSDPDEILINAFGQLYSEVSASSLIKVDLDGTVIDGGSTKFGVNQAGYVLHSAIHKGRPEIKCVVHLHHPSVVAVSAQKCGLLPISQEAMIVGEVAYHEYSGILLDEAERELLVRDLGDRHVMILRNHGFVVCGESIEHALSQTYHLIIACETQVKTVPGGNTDNVHFPPESAIKQVYKVASQGGGGVNRQNGHVNSTQWRRGELEWQAYMRQLDAQGLNTGHVYTN